MLLEQVGPDLQTQYDNSGFEVSPLATLGLLAGSRIRDVHQGWSWSWSWGWSEGWRGGAEPGQGVATPGAMSMPGNGPGNQQSREAAWEREQAPSALGPRPSAS